MSKKNEGRAGFYIHPETENRAFMPAPLPPDPPLRLGGSLLALLSEADWALGRLDSTAELIPNPDLFVRMYIRKEAVYSSQIEGTQASLADLLEYETDSSNKRKRPDAAEVHNYVNAMNSGLSELESIPLSLRLIKQIHRILLEGVRGSERAPGEFRRTQVWVGPHGASRTEARYVPPPPNEVMSTMARLEEFIHDESPMPILVRCGLVHAQFEMIHPFLDGNGRIGRLLVTFMLCWRDALSRPLLYISDYLKRNRDEYYERLRDVSDLGDWEGWMGFFLRGVKEVSLQATVTARRILALRDEHRHLVRQEVRSLSAETLLESLYESPVVNVKLASDVMDRSRTSAHKALRKFVELGLLHELTGKSRNRLYMYKPYVDLFN